MRLQQIPVVVALVLAGAMQAGATSYPPVTFDELVTRADVIFVGEVVDVRPFPLDTRDGTVVMTRVVFRVTDPLHGTTGLVEALDFFGGEWGDLGMAIAGMPGFSIGDRRVVFARREQSINPIVGFTQGLLRIRLDAGGVDRVETLDGAPLGSVEAIGARAAGGGTTGSPLRLSALRERIVNALARRPRR